MDKGNTVVILNRKDYVCKMKNTLNDRSKFKKVYVDHDKILNDSIHMEKRVTDVLKNLRAKREISTEQCKNLRFLGSGPAIMYGLAEVHKLRSNWDFGWELALKVGVIFFRWDLKSPLKKIVNTNLKKKKKEK